MFENIIDIILSTYDLSLSNDERRKRFEIINNYQANDFVLDDLKDLLNPINNQEVKIFGFNCLENLILYKWHVVDKAMAKTYLIEIITEYGHLSLDASAERVVRWILAKTMVYFIRHECPQNCNSIIEDLINLKDNGIMTKALILSIFFCLSETLPNDSQMPDNRKKEVISFVTERSNIIISFCVDVVKEYFTNASKEVINLPQEAVKTIQSLTSWIKYETLLSMSEQILSVIIQSLVVDSSDYYLLEVLETIFERKVKTEDRYCLFSKIITNEILWQRLIVNISTGLTIPINPYSDDKYRYLQKMFDVLLIIGNLVIANWQRFVKDSTQIMIDNLMDLILMATHHPIKILSVEFLSFWSNGFKNDEQESLRTILVSKAQSLLPLLKSMSIKQNIRDPSNADYEYLENLIEDSDVESYLSRIRIEISKTVGVLTQYFTQDIIALTLDWVFNVVNAIKELEDQNIESLNTLAADSPQLKELEASRYFTRCVMHNIFKPYSKTLRDSVRNVLSVCSKELLSKCRMISLNIIAYKDLNVHISNTYLDSLCLLLPLVANDQAVIEQCLVKIFTWYNKIDTVDISCLDYGLLKQLNMDCGVWLLRIFRDYNFLIPVSLFEKILAYHQSKCFPIYSRPIIMEAMTLYICHSGNYNTEQKKALLKPFVESIRSVVCSEQVFRLFENGLTVIGYLQMDKPKPINNEDPNYPSLDHVCLRTNLSQSLNALLGLCRRLSSDQNETEIAMINTKLREAPSLIACSMFEDLLPILPSLLIMIRALNQVWCTGKIHPDFKCLLEVSANFRESLMKPQSNHEKFHHYNERGFGDVYVFGCQYFISKLQEAIWNLFAKYCISFGTKLYSLPDWGLGVTEYVFADLGLLPNFKLMLLIKSFLIPFVQFCPPELAREVLVPSIVPFLNYVFSKLGERWTLVADNVHFNDFDNECDMENASAEEQTDLSNEIIDEQILRISSRAFVNLLKFTVSIGSSLVEESKPLQSLGTIGDALCQMSDGDNHYPIVLVLLNHICNAMTWKDSYCSSKLCQLIVPFTRLIHSHGLLTIDVIIFIIQQSIRVLNIFTDNSVSDIRLTIINLGVYIYEEYLAKDPEFMERFIQLFDKSPSKDIHTFQHKMLPTNSAKVKREAYQNILRPYIGVPTNEMFSQQVCIKNLPPLLKPEWRSKNQRQLSFDGSETLSLSNLFD